MRRITAEDMKMSFERYRRALESLDITKPDHRLEYQTGSRANGVSYKVVWTHVTSGGHSNAPGTDFGGYLGFTRREAFETLNTISRTIEDVAFRNYELGREA